MLCSLFCIRDDELLMVIVFVNSALMSAYGSIFRCFFFHDQTYHFHCRYVPLHYFLHPRSKSTYVWIQIQKYVLQYCFTFVKKFCGNAVTEKRYVMLCSIYTLLKEGKEMPVCLVTISRHVRDALAIIAFEDILRCFS